MPVSKEKTRDGRASGGGRSPDCLHCEHYFVTWETDRPRGCRAYGFKSSELPSDVVRTTSGEPCQLFRPKRRAGEKTRLIR
jgi:hypothetical protein